MKRLLILVVLGLLAWQGYAKYESSLVGREEIESSADIAQPMISSPQFTCDGRIYCSQMRSCEEATFFLRNCPGVKMDGDNDGIPCERQWCTGPFAK